MIAAYQMEDYGDEIGAEDHNEVDDTCGRQAKRIDYFKILRMIKPLPSRSINTNEHRRCAVCQTGIQAEGFRERKLALGSIYHSFLKDFQRGKQLAKM